MTEAGASASTALGVVREHWEVLAAAGILVGVLAVIDGAALGQPSLLLSMAPFGFLVYAALFPLTARAIVTWTSVLALAAFWGGVPSYAGLAYPAFGLAIPLALHRMLSARRGG
jgi:hypothetical protein